MRREGIIRVSSTTARPTQSAEKKIAAAAAHAQRQAEQQAFAHPAAHRALLAGSDRLGDKPRDCQADPGGREGDGQDKHGKYQLVQSHPFGADFRVEIHPVAHIHGAQQQGGRREQYGVKEKDTFFHGPPRIQQRSCYQMYEGQGADMKKCFFLKSLFTLRRENPIIKKK